MTAKDLTAIATCCPQLESLAFSNFRVDAEVDHRYRNQGGRAQLDFSLAWLVAALMIQ